VVEDPGLLLRPGWDGFSLSLDLEKEAERGKACRRIRVFSEKSLFGAFYGKKSSLPTPSKSPICPKSFFSVSISLFLGLKR